jgi:uncharacterized protein
MIILFSPAKTFRNTDVVHLGQPVFEKKAHRLIRKLKRLSIDDIQKSMKVSLKVAQETHHDYQQFGHIQSPAIYTYYGQAYKSLDIDSIPFEKVLIFNQYLYIISGLYGLLKPLDGISRYRLEMKDKTVVNLYTHWKKNLHDALKSADLIINLASKEYDQIVDSKLPMVTISFVILNNQIYKSPSMEVKTMRGAFLREILLNEIHSIEAIKKISLLNYHYDADQSDDQTLVFIKRT